MVVSLLISLMLSLVLSMCINVRLVPSGERLSICWVGGNLGIAPAAGASLFTAG